MVVRPVLLITLAAMAAACGDRGSSDSSTSAGAPVGTYPVATLSSTSSATTATSTNSTTTTTTTTSPTTTSTTVAIATAATVTITPSPSTAAVVRTVDSVVVAGDSMALSLYPPVRAALGTESTKVRFEWVLGVALVGAMAQWERIFNVDRPDVVVAHFMPWENAALREGAVIDSSDPDWATAYRVGWVEPWIELALSTGSTLVWVLQPLTADPDRTRQHGEVGAVWVDAIEQHNAVLPDDDPSRILVVETVDISAGPDGAFVAIDHLVDPAERLFNTDGLHWCPAGAARLSDRLLDILRSVGIATASERTPDWRTSPWAVEGRSVGAGLGFPYPPGECPDPTDG